MMKSWMAAILFSGWMTASVWAQGAAPAPAAPTVTYVSSRNPMIDGAIFVVLAGGALFAVCRNSSRV